MKATKSKLVLNDFVVLQCVCNSFPFETEVTNIMDVINSYPVDIDYSIQHDEEHDLYMILVMAKSNPDKMPGYSYLIEAAVIFTFEGELSSDEKMQLLNYSGVSIGISNIRSFLANTTSYYPFGRYNFHSVDMNSLLRDKAEAIKSEHEK